MGSGEAEAGRRGGMGGERVGSAGWCEMDGDGGGREGAKEVGVVGCPEGGCGPVKSGGGDKAGFVLGDVVAEELK